MGFFGSCGWLDLLEGQGRLQPQSSEIPSNVGHLGKATSNSGDQSRALARSIL